MRDASRGRAGRAVAVGFLLLLSASPTLAAGRRGGGLWMGGRRVALSAATRALPIPSFSRQTKLACNVCHTAFLQLTPFGRLFKLNGYTMTGIEKVTAGKGAAGAGLSLDLIPPVSVMVQASLTHVSDAPPGTENDQAEFPDQMSLFVGEAITPRIGTFLQFTYAGPDGSFGWDNADIRFANHASIGGRPIIYGVTLNNNPSVQDVWNSTPAWSWPFAGSSVAPGPAAATAVEGDLAQRVAGLGGYIFWNNLLYAELTGYRSAPQGGPHPADETAEQTIEGVSPYWRVALSHDMQTQSIEVGTFGLSTREYPSGITGLTNGYTDIGLDGQYQYFFANSNITAHGSYIREKQNLNAGFQSGDAANNDDVLHSFKADAELVLQSGIAPGLGFFATSGGADPGLYPEGEVDGSLTHKPNSSGFIAELDVNPWLNTRLTAQYVLYSKFNGASTNYDGAGRNASDNNTLYLLAWLVF